MNHSILEMKGISKAFLGVQALQGVDLRCEPGEVHALAGENGAGKTTLMKILAGAYRHDEGRICLEGKDVSFNSTKEAQKHGISIIFQEFNLMPELNIAENIFLGREPKKAGWILDTTQMVQTAREILGSLRLDLDVMTKAKNLTVSQQQLVEVAKALSLNANLLIMDEPSSAISLKETEVLFRIIESLKAQGKAIIYISHRLDEIFQIADRVTVLKDGRLMGTRKIDDLSKEEIVKMMVGRNFEEVFPASKKGEKREILFIENVSRTGVLKRINLKVYSGEILGLAGLVGSGRTELARVIFGADSFDEGKISMHGSEISSPTIWSSINRGIGFVTEDRKKEGFIHNQSVRVNLTLPILKRFQNWGFLDHSKEEQICEDSIDQFNIATPSMEQEIQYLSGGNQQKVVLAKWLNANPQLIIMDEPTRGIDVGAKTEIYHLMRQLTEKGTGILMISSELPEIIGMSDRIVVMSEGKIMGELSPDNASEERIMMMATGETNQMSEG